MLIEEPAYISLKQSCRELDLPQETVLELLRFLTLLGSRFGCTMEGSGLSPSVKMDKLWHHMLLNTRPCVAIPRSIQDCRHALGDEQAAPVRMAALAAARRSVSTTSKKQSSPSHMDPQELFQHIQELAATCEEHSQLYYSGQQQLSDDAFDAIRHRLSDAEEEWERLTGQQLPVRASKQVGASVGAVETPSSAASLNGPSTAWGALQTVQHAIPMLSLAARNSKQEVEHWHDVSFTNNLQRLPGKPSPRGLAWVLEPKIDGLAVNATYQDGHLVQLATRGDGKTGQDVTRHVPNIQGLPAQLRFPLAPLPSQKTPNSSVARANSSGGTPATGHAAGRGRARSKQPSQTHAQQRQQQQQMQQSQGDWLQGGPLEMPCVLEVRGEVYMTKSDFQAFLAGSNGAGAQASSKSRRAENATTTTSSSSSGGSSRSSSRSSSRYEATQSTNGHENESGGQAHVLGVGSNPRNTAAGILRSQDPAQSARTRLSFLAYQLLRSPVQLSDSNGAEQPQQQQQQQQPLYLARSQYDSLQCLEAAGFDVSKDVARFGSFREALDAAEEWMVQRDQLAYEVDGSVIKLDDQDLVGQLGAKHSDPLWAIAWKFPPMETTTRVTGISLTLGKQGKVTPIALLEPVNIGGVVVKQASLGNAMLPMEMGLHLGDLVVLIRANDVIPKIEGVVPGQRRRPGSQPWQPPSKCPSCSKPLVMENRDLMCHNPQCSGRGTKQIEVFAKVCLEGSQLAGKSVKALVDAGVLRSIPDLYSMTPESLLRLPRWGPKKVQPIMDAIAHSRKHLSLQQLLQGLAISSVGGVTAILLAKHYRSLRELQADAETGVVAGMAGKNMEKLVAWFASPDNKALIDRLAEAGVACVEGPPAGSTTAAANRDDATTQDEPSQTFKVNAAPPSSGPLSGENIVITGTCEAGTRAQVADVLRSWGAEVEKRMSSRTTMMVVGEVPAKEGKPTYSLRKLEDAKKKGVKVVLEKDLGIPDNIIGKV